MANHNIDLGTFEWDISQIEKQLIENRRQMEAFGAALKVNKKALNDEKKEMQSLAVEIKAMGEAQKVAAKALSDGEITVEQYNEAMALTTDVIKDNEAAISSMAGAQNAHIKTILEQERAVKELRLETNELNKLMEAGRTDIEGNEFAYRELNKELNASKTEAKNLGAELVNLRRAGKENTDEYRDLEAQWKKASAEADALNDEFKELDKAVGDNQRTVGDYTDSIKKAFADLPSQIASGDIQGAFNTLKTGFAEVSTFIKANPFLLIASGIALMVREVWNYNEAVKESQKLVAQLTNTSGKMADDIRVNAQAIADTYKRDFSESVRELNTLMIKFGVDADEAFRIYNEGLAQGGAANNEFGDSIREYGGLFAQNGYSAHEFINILNAGIDLGIYSDKLPDAIKEAGLSLNEQTTATKDALTNAFGASFSEDILARVRAGQTTVADALAEISKKAEESNLNQQQLAQLTADVFRGAGEDAGGALKVFEAINNAQEIQTENLTDLERATINLAEKNRELAEAKDEAFKSDAVIDFQQTVTTMWKDVQIAWYKYLGQIIQRTQKEIAFLKLIFANVRGAVTAIPRAFALVFGGINKDFQQLANLGRTVGQILANIANPQILAVSVQSLFSQVKGFTSFAAQSIREVQNLGNQINTTNRNNIAAQREASVKASKAMAEAQEIANKKIVKDAAGSGGSGSSSKGVRSATAARDESAKIAEQEAKKAAEVLKERADLTADNAKLELAEYIANNQAKIAEEKRLTAEKLKAQIDYYKELESLGLKELEAQREKDLLGRTEEEKDVIRREYALKEKALNDKTQSEIASANKEMAAQNAEDQKQAEAIEFQQKLIDLEDKMATEWEMRNVVLEGQKEHDLEMLELDRENGLISMQNYEGKKKLIESAAAAESKRIAKEIDDYKIESRTAVLGGLADLFGRESVLGKTFALAEIVNDTVTQSSKAFTQAALFAANPLTAALAPNAYFQGGIIVATGAAQAAKLVMPKKDKKAARGMLIQGPSHAGGGVSVSTPNGTIEAEGGEVIINKLSSMLFRDQLSAINQAGGGVKFAGGGVIPSRMATVQNSISVNAGDTLLSQEAISKIAAAIYTGAQQGIGDMADNRKIIDGANF